MLWCDFRTTYFMRECQPTCALAVNVERVPLLELELPTDPCAVKVLEAVDLWDLWSLLLYC